VAVGDTVGVVVGAAVGDTVGVVVGVAVGDTVGVAVGAAVGDTVGVAVGVAVGDTVGVAVGVAVGPAWATAAHTVRASAAITRGTTTKRRIVVFDTVASLSPTAEGFGGTVEASPTPQGVGCVPALHLLLYYVNTFLQGIFDYIFIN